MHAQVENIVELIIFTSQKQVLLDSNFFLHMISNAVIYLFECIETEIKLLTCCKQLFEMHVLQSSCFILIENSQELFQLVGTIDKKSALVYKWFGAI